MRVSKYALKLQLVTFANIQRQLIQLFAGTAWTTLWHLLILLSRSDDDDEGIVY